MKTTIFLLALYSIFGFFACKQEKAVQQPVARRHSAGAMREVGLMSEALPLSKKEYFVQKPGEKR